MHLQRSLLALSMLAMFSHPVCGEETEGGAKKTSEAPSPDGRFAFRYGADSETEAKVYNLVGRKSGKVLARVAEADPDPSPSARFYMKVLWRPDSKAFALTATLWKRGSEVVVYLRRGATFREVKLPELVAEIPDEVKGGKELQHVSELNSQSATRWKKDRSLVVEIESMEDGNDGSVTAARTVVLGFGRSSQAKALKSTVKFATEKP